MKREDYGDIREGSPYMVTWYSEAAYGPTGRWGLMFRGIMAITGHISDPSEGHRALLLLWFSYLQRLSEIIWRNHFQSFIFRFCSRHSQTNSLTVTELDHLILPPGRVLMSRKENVPKVTQLRQSPIRVLGPDSQPGSFHCRTSSTRHWRIERPTEETQCIEKSPGKCWSSKKSIRKYTPWEY